MTRIRVLIIDDERSARMELQRMVEKYTELEVIGQSANADEAEVMILDLKPDLLFLDIQMPGRSGFQLLESLDFLPLVIFTTAFDAYAVQAFEVTALDYLMKPIREERFAKAIALVKHRFKTYPEPSIFVKDRNQYHIIQWREVHLIESMDNYARLFFGDKSVFLKSSLNQLTEKLDPDLFFRTGRAQLINLNFIESIRQENSKMVITLKTGQNIEVSSRQTLAFKNKNRK